MSSTVSTSSYMPSEYISGGLGISGLTSNGTDFTQMIDQLRKIEMIPTQRMLRWKADWVARQDAFGQVRSALVALRDVCNKMNTMDRFLVKQASSSVPGVASASASSVAVQNSYKLEVNQIATTSIWSLKNEFSSNTANINQGTANATFSYEYAGSTRTLTIPPNTTLEQFKNMINNDASNKGVRASIIKSANGVTFQLKGMDQGEKNDLAILSSDGLFGFPDTSVYQPHQLTYKTSITDKDNAAQPANSATTEQVFTYEYNGQKVNATIRAGATLQQMVDDISATLPPGLTVNLTQSAPGAAYELTFTGSDPGKAIKVQSGAPFAALGTPTTVSGDPEAVAGDPDSNPWHVQHSQNAKIKVDGWPSGASNWLEVSGNTIDDVVEGVTFTLIDEGETMVSVNTDTEAVQENVIEFVDAMNTFRSVINELTKYNANKATVDLEYAESLYEMQKGSILTGNYGVQLVSSRIKQATAGMPPGFMPRKYEGDLMFGDMFTSLSQIGIKTNADGEGGEMFGMLILNTDPSMPTLDQVLKDNPEAVAEFFAAVNKGVSDSSNFSFSSSMQNITRPGAYDVSYKVVDDGSGNPTIVDAFINGKAAKWDASTNQLGLTRIPPTSTNGSVAAASTDGQTNFNADVEVTQVASPSSVKIETQATSVSDAFATGSGRFYYTYNGKEYSVDVTGPGTDAGGNPTQGDSLAMIAAKINYHYTNPGVKATTVKGADGKYSLAIESKQNGDENVFNTMNPGNTNHGTSFDFTTSVVTNSYPAYATGTDASYKITYENPPGSAPKTVEVNDGKSNSVTVAGLPGVTFNLKGVGTASTVGVKHNGADGLFIQIDNLTISNNTYNGTVRIKQGKINELLEMLNGTTMKPEEGILGSKGTLQILVDNYDKIIEGIDEKIERETARLIKWERTQKLRFSRLEATLKQYESLQAGIESQIKQLGGNDK